MGQETIIQFLEHNKNKWFSSHDLSALTKIGLASVSCSLKRLRKQKVVKWKMRRATNGTQYYVYSNKE